MSKRKGSRRNIYFTGECLEIMAAYPEVNWSMWFQGTLYRFQEDAEHYAKWFQHERFRHNGKIAAERRAAQYENINAALI